MSLGCRCSTVWPLGCVAPLKTLKHNWRTLAVHFARH